MLDDEGDYESLLDVISMHEFEFEHWPVHEERIIRPQLEAKGYTDIFFKTGERDHTLVLSRIVVCVDPDGNIHRFIYS